MNTMKLITCIMWALLLGVFTSTNNLDALLQYQSVHFQWNSHPNFMDLFIISDAHVTDPYWLFIKTGHFFGFGILEALLVQTFEKRKLAAIVAVGYAIVTEILQLYFMRDGRLLDMGIDAAGVLLSYLGSMLYQQRGLLFRNKTS